MYVFDDFILFLFVFSPVVKVESPRPTSRKKNKPAPIPPGLSATGGPKTSPQTKTPEKEERKVQSSGAGEIFATLERDKPSLPPTGQ